MDCRKISEITRKSNGYMFLYGILFMIFIINVTLKVNAGSAAEFLYGIAGCSGWLFLMSWTYTESFLIINNSFSETGISKGINLSRLALLHGFDCEEYFSYIAAGLVPRTVVLMIISALSCLFLYTGENRTMLLISLMALIPPVTFAGLSAGKKVFINSACRKKETVKNSGIRHIINLVSYAGAAWYITTLIFAIFVIPLGINPFSAGDIDSLCVPAYQINSEVSMCLPLGIGIVFASVLMLCSVFFKNHGRFLKKAGYYALLSIMVLAGSSIWLSSNYYSVRTTTEGIVLCEKGHKTNYSFDDVESLSFYYSEEIYGPQISVCMKDGKEFSLMDSQVLLSDDFRYYFDSTAEFAEYVVMQMADAGADYQISDIEKIRSSAGYKSKNIVYPDTIYTGA